MALFQQNTGSSGSSNKNFVEFKCGKMTRNGTTVTADTRKGLLYVHRGEDSLIHFCWKDRTAGTVDANDDLLLFPDEAEFLAVPQCTTGRVFVLKFKANDKRLFFWMQEPDKNKDKDKDLMEKVNESINNPPAPGSDFGGSGSAGNAINSMMNGLNQEEVMRLLSSSGGNPSQLQQIQSILQSQIRSQGESSGPPFRSGRGSHASSTKKEEKKDEKKEEEASPAAPATPVNPPTPATPATPAASTPGVQLQDLQSILRNMNVPTTAPGAASPSGPTPCDITEAMKPDDIIPMLANEKVRESLVKHLPDSTRIPKTEAELKETIHSPQFQQACNAFSSALSTGQLGPALQQFGVPPAAVDAANKGDVAAFAKAMEEGVKSGSTEEKAEEKMETD